jgi:hypothetical protein
MIGLDLAQGCRSLLRTYRAHWEGMREENFVLAVAQLPLDLINILSFLLFHLVNTAYWALFWEMLICIAFNTDRNHVSETVQVKDMLPIPVDVAKYLLLHLEAHAWLYLVLLPLSLVYLAQVCHFERCLCKGCLGTISTALLPNDGSLSNIAANI